MTLKNLADDVLIERLKKLVHEEREILMSVLHHLREVERRRLFSKYQCASLFAYAVTELKYSESQADRRISAMRLLRDVPQTDTPQIEAKITSGALSLTNLVLAQTLFSKEKKAGRQMDAETKLTVLSRLENQTSRQAEKIVCGISPEMLARKKELNFNLIDDDSLREKLLRLKGHYAHVQPNMSLADLLHRLCDEKLESIHKLKSPSAPGTRKKSGTAPAASKPLVNLDSDICADSYIAGGAHIVDATRTTPSHAEVRRHVWRRDRGRCSNCHSTYALEIDHVQPRAMGGPSTLTNTRLLCRACNQRAAIEYFGLAKMTRHLERSPLIVSL